MVECLYQPLQTVSISFVPLFGNIGGAPPNGVSIHLFGSTERRLKLLPSHDTLVNAVVRVCASQGSVGKRPFAGIEAIPLVNEGCGVSLPSARFREDCLPSIAVARPLVQDKDAGEVAKIANTLQPLTRQVVECHCRTFAANVQRSQLLAAPARNLGTTQTDSEIFGLLDQPVRDFNHFDPWHRQPQGQRIAAFAAASSRESDCSEFDGLFSMGFAFQCRKLRCDEVAGVLTKTVTQSPPSASDVSS